MKQKEKAKELFNEMYTCYQGHIDKYTAKQCALIAVDEIMKAPFENTYLELVPDDAPDTDWFWDKFREYWEEVKQEIEKL